MREEKGARVVTEGAVSEEEGEEDLWCSGDISDIRM
jgi:hypothetical protein